MPAKTGPRDKYIETRSYLVQTRACVHKYVLCAHLGSLSRLHLPGSCGAGLCMHVWRLCVPIQFRSQVVGGEHRAQGTMDAESSKHPPARQAEHDPRTRACAHKPSNVFYGCCVLRDPMSSLLGCTCVHVCADIRM